MFEQIFRNSYKIFFFARSLQTRTIYTFSIYKYSLKKTAFNN